MKRRFSFTAQPDSELFLESHSKRCHSSFGFAKNVCFPAFEALPSPSSPGIYFSFITTIDGKQHLRPVRNWCFMAEILYVLEGRVAVKSATGVTFIELASDQIPSTFKWCDLKKGSTIAVLYALKTMLGNNCEGIRVPDLNHVYVFNASMSILNYYASTIVLKADDNNSAGLSPQALVIQWLLTQVQCDFSRFLSFSWIGALEAERNTGGMQY
ncbi:hypothetical protein BCR33DRAFT_710955 [Rhizoclosmatium globosum]|uniref:Uncharacterized protein n=1 Tax=Rhizoclosmatium globosum TaxID=329046 RepID=A0A1Y2D2S0_9FUNG|nr:hypothetical protein BCR33DRAFT_710955 [Rhizoclosmatium globosum]|eukprot:ORY53550.1 hypothetical protein BCR33DRAFT_710955 [Rhizoclosmatium globosum]